LARPNFEFQKRQKELEKKRKKEEKKQKKLDRAAAEAPSADPPVAPAESK
jgi:Skp family chaperone for outer membrane proteins